MDQPAQELPQVFQDHANVVATAAEHCEEGVALGSLERAAREAAVALHVPDHGFDGAAPSQEPGDGTILSMKMKGSRLPAPDMSACCAIIR